MAVRIRPSVGTPSLIDRQEREKNLAATYLIAWSCISTAPSWDPRAGPAGSQVNSLGERLTFPSYLENADQHTTRGGLFGLYVLRSGTR